MADSGDRFVIRGGEARPQQAGCWTDLPGAWACAAPSSLEKLRHLPALIHTSLSPPSPCPLPPGTKAFLMALKMEQILVMVTCDRMDWWSLPSPVPSLFFMWLTLLVPQNEFWCGHPMASSLLPLGVLGLPLSQHTSRWVVLLSFTETALTYSAV